MGTDAGPCITDSRMAAFRSKTDYDMTKQHRVTENSY